MIHLKGVHTRWKIIDVPGPSLSRQLCSSYPTMSKTGFCEQIVLKEIAISELLFMLLLKERSKWVH